jgi:hypothetical protein
MNRPQVIYGEFSFAPVPSVRFPFPASFTKTNRNRAEINAYIDEKDAGVGRDGEHAQVPPLDVH